MDVIKWAGQEGMPAACATLVRADGGRMDSRNAATAPQVALRKLQSGRDARKAERRDARNRAGRFIILLFKLGQHRRRKGRGGGDFRISSHGNTSSKLPSNGNADLLRQLPLTEPKPSRGNVKCKLAKISALPLHYHGISETPMVCEYLAEARNCHRYTVRSAWRARSEANRIAHDIAQQP